MEIRQAMLNEVEAIIEIEKACFPLEEAAQADTIRDRFKVFEENFIVAVDNGRVIGFINGCTTDKPELPDELYHNVELHKPEGRYQTVFGLDVLPQYRKQGIAAKLMEYFIEMSKAGGKEAIILTCKDYLINYYKKFGFQHQGVSSSSHGGSKWNDMVLEIKKKS